MSKTVVFSLLIGLAFSLNMQAQKKASPHDFGKMWTFENPPKEWLKETYGMDVKDEWFDYMLCFDSDCFHSNTDSFRYDEMENCQLCV